MTNESKDNNQSLISRGGGVLLKMFLNSEKKTIHNKWQQFFDKAF